MAGCFGHPVLYRGGLLPAALLLVCLSAAFSLATPVRAEDPPALDTLNRSIHTFNRDYAGSATTATQDTNRFFIDTVPGKVRQGISNFLSNLGEPLTAIASVAEGDYANARIAAHRFLYNTTLGFGGVVDRASEQGLRSENRGLNDVLCRYELPEGPFLVVPFYGPATAGEFVGSMLPVMAGYVTLGEVFWLFRAGSQVAAYVAGEGDSTNSTGKPRNGTGKPGPAPAAPSSGENPSSGEKVSPASFPGPQAPAPSPPPLSDQEREAAYKQARERYLAERRAACELHRSHLPPLGGAVGPAAAVPLEPPLPAGDAWKSPP